MQRVDTLEDLERFLGIELSAYYPTPAIDHPGICISKVGQNIAAAVKRRELEAVKIAHLILMKDPSLPFGKLIKSEIARALRQHSDLLTSSEREDVIRKTSELLSMEFCPREVEDYCKLVKKFGSEAVGAVVETTYARNEKSKSLLSSLKTPNLSLHTDADGAGELGR